MAASIPSIVLDEKTSFPCCHRMICVSDGSVRSMSYSVDPNMFLIFCQISSGMDLDWSSF
jgi:hypothetical protein